MQGQCLLFPIDFFFLLIHTIDSDCLVTCSQSTLQRQDGSAFLYPFQNMVSYIVVSSQEKLFHSKFSSWA